MAVCIAHDRTNQVAVLYCNTQDIAFGPIFQGPDAHEDAEQFLEWLSEHGPVRGYKPIVGDGGDPRDYQPQHLEAIVALWRFHVDHNAPVF